MFNGVEVLATEAWQGSAVDLGIAADEIMDARLEGLPVGGVDPALGGFVAILAEDRSDLPVLWFLGEEVATLDQQDARAALAQGVGECPAAHAGADDDDVKMSHSSPLPTRSPKLPLP